MTFNKNFLSKTNLGITIVIIIGILAVLNFFSYQIFYRWDLTQNKDYSLSAASKKTVANLKDIVNIKAYFSQDLPAQFLNLRQEVADILDEYVSYSGGNIKVEFINPGSDEETERQLYFLGIPKLQFNALEKDKLQVVNGYLGMVISFADKQQVIPVVQDTTNLEYQITAAIKKVTSDQLAKIGLWQENGTADFEKEISLAYKKLSELYQVVPISLQADQQIPPEIKTLIIIGPKEKFSDEELKAIDKFFVSGGSFLILADGVKVGQGLTAEKNELGLDKILISYGLKLNNDLVKDVSSGLASFSQGFITFTTNYPFWPKVLKAGFDQTNVATAKLETLLLPWASSIEVDQEKNKDNKIFYLAKTTNQASLETDNFNLSPQANFFANQSGAQYNLAVAVLGKFSSAFGQGETDHGRLILVGDSDFIADNFLQRNPDNLVFFQNLVDSLSLDEDLINIRSKGITERPIKELSEAQKTIARYTNIFVLTTVVILFGMTRYFLRRRRKLFDEI